MGYRAPRKIRTLLIALLGSSFCFAAVHPARVDENSDCRECHADKTTGNNLHAALQKGCAGCHTIELRADATYINLKLAGAAGCFACHPQAAFHYPHFPYASGMCVRCHDPHSSSSPKLLRARVNDLCLACHLRSAEAAESRYMPTIALTDNNTLGHPYAQHPVSGKMDPLTGAELSCVSCHAPHGGSKMHLLRMGGQIPEDVLNEIAETRDMCAKCHDVLWGVDPAPGGKKKTKNKR